ncbi:MAG: pirin family protein [Candidatus Aenigmarchaeota archaeon]|nr:pirin family protein [Candidatus Aenigmarchaeota archaeon]
MNIDIQRSSDRGTTRTNWLNSRHSFSFGNYFNPARMGFGLLKVLNDDIIEPGGGFPTHHHDNMEIVTIVLEGALQHKDSSGGEGVIKPGEVQAMSAGRGIYHSEFNASDKEPVHLLQIWVGTAQQDLKPGYGQKKARNSMTIPVAGGADRRSEGAVSPGLHINQDAQFYLGELEKGIETEHEVETGKGSYVFVISGSIEMARQQLGEGDAAGITDTRTFPIKALEDSRILVIDVPMDN